MVSKNETCDDFLQGDCDYTGEIIHESFESISGRVSCRKGCEETDGCNYWTYNETNRHCTWRKDGNRTCKSLYGPIMTPWWQCEYNRPSTD